jgi:molybdopterin synthase sulfur carrier subunit
MSVDIEVRYFAAARAAAGMSSQRIHPGTLSNILSELADANPALAHVIAQCSFLVDSVVAIDFDMPVNAGSVIDVLPRFAGG